MGYGPTSTLVDVNGNPIGTAGNPFEVQLATAGATQPVNVVQWGGVAPGAANPVLTDAIIGAYIKLGQGFLATSGNLATATNPNLQICAISIFNPAASGKSLLIYSILVTQNGSETGHELYTKTTTNPNGGAGFTNTLTPVNMNFASATVSVASVASTATGATASVTVAGSTIGVFAVNSNSSTELVPKGSYFWLPAGTAAGIAMYTQVGTAGNDFSGQAQWLEV